MLIFLKKVTELAYPALNGRRPNHLWGYSEVRENTLYALKLSPVSKAYILRLWVDF